MTSSDLAETQPTPRARITEAAARLLREVGAGGVTTRAVAQAAGVPAPTIFRLFGDKDGLMDAVAEHVMATYVAGKVDGADPDDSVLALRRAWASHVDFGLANPDLFVLLSTPGRVERSAATVAGIGVLHVRVARLAAAGLLAVPSRGRSTSSTQPAPGRCSRFSSRRPERRDPSLADAMLEAALGVVLTETPAPPSSDLVALAIAFRAAVPDLRRSPRPSAGC